MKIMIDTSKQNIHTIVFRFLYSDGVRKETSKTITQALRGSSVLYTTAKQNNIKGGRTWNH